MPPTDTNIYPGQHNNEAFTKYISMLKKYKSGGYYTFSSRDLEWYLNYALHKIQRSSEQGNVTNKQEMER